MVKEDKVLYIICNVPHDVPLKSIVTNVTVQRDEATFVIVINL